MDYQKKYTKYKTKYISIKKLILSGGGGNKKKKHS